MLIASTPARRGLLIGLDVLGIVLVILVVAQAHTDPLAVASAVAFGVVQVGGTVLLRPAARPVDAPRGMLWPDGAWILLLAAVWLLVLVSAGVPGIWLAFPLMLLQMHVLGPRRGILAVVVTAVVAVGTGLALGLDRVGTVVGPTIGAALSVAIVLGLEALVRESEQRRATIEELLATRRQLAESEHARGVHAERERIAREIHDTLAQGLSSIELLLRAAQETGDDSGVQRARDVARANLAEARTMVRGLAPADLSGASLDDALGRVVQRAAGVVTHWSVVGEPREVPVDVSAALVRIAQSSIANVERHADAAHVTVTLSYLDASLALDVVDDGRGFDPAIEGFGLATMRQRVDELGGRLSVESSPGRGTAVAVEVPT